MPLRIPLVAGLLLIGAGLLLMRGLDVADDWTRLLPGFLVGGLAIGVISPALAAAMVGVLPVERSGLASGINNTFRQLGIAVGIAGLGAIFEHHIRRRRDARRRPRRRPERHLPGRSARRRGRGRRGLAAARTPAFIDVDLFGLAIDHSIMRRPSGSCGSSAAGRPGRAPAITANASPIDVPVEAGQRQLAHRAQDVLGRVGGDHRRAARRSGPAPRSGRRWSGRSAGRPSGRSPAPPPGPWS